MSCFFSSDFTYSFTSCVGNRFGDSANLYENIELFEPDVTCRCLLLFPTSAKESLLSTPWPWEVTVILCVPMLSLRFLKDRRISCLEIWSYNSFHVPKVKFNPIHHNIFSNWFIMKELIINSIRLKIICLKLHSFFQLLNKNFSNLKLSLE